MSTHNAVATAAVRTPPVIIQVPTVQPLEREVLVRVEWTASTPLDLHQNDGGLLVKHPQILGDGVAGTVVQTGPNVKNLIVGDHVFGFSFAEAKSKAHQEFVTVAETFLGKIPEGFTPQEAVTLPNNVVTVFHTVTADLALPLPWPRPATLSVTHSQAPILIWGGASSCGQYALQILSHWGYKNLFTTASPTHHAYLHSLGASHVFDYQDPNVAERILEIVAYQSGERIVPFIMDCIGSKSGSLLQLAKIAQSGTRVAVLLPVILKDATNDEAPEYTFDIKSSAHWVDGVELRGVRTHFYAENPFFKEHLQSTIIPALLAEGIIKPNKQRIVEGETILDRARKALEILRRKEVSGERLVWRISEPLIES